MLQEHEIFMMANRSAEKAALTQSLFMMGIELGLSKNNNKISNNKSQIRN